MQVIQDASAATLRPFVQATVAPGPIVRTDTWQGYRGLDKLGYDHDRRSQRGQGAR